MKHEIGIANLPTWSRTGRASSTSSPGWNTWSPCPTPSFWSPRARPTARRTPTSIPGGSWSASGDHYSSLLALLDNTHTYANILREGEWCVNWPSAKYHPQCFATIHCNGPDNDEIVDAGLTAEPARTVQAPRIAECAINLECKLAWHRPLYEDSRWHLFLGRVLHVAMDEAVMAVDPDQRMEALGLMYNVRGTVNPLDGEYYGPNTLGLLKQVLRTFDLEQEKEATHERCPLQRPPFHPDARPAARAASV